MGLLVWFAIVICCVLFVDFLLMFALVVFVLFSFVHFEF